MSRISRNTSQKAQKKSPHTRPISTPCERLDPLVSHSEGLCNHKGESIEQNQASAVQEDDEFDVDAQRTMLKSINKIHCSKIQVQLNSDDEILVWERIKQPTRLYLGLRVTVRLRAPNTLTAANTKKLILDHLTQVWTHPQVISRIPVTLKLPVAQGYLPCIEAIMG